MLVKRVHVNRNAALDASLRQDASASTGLILTEVDYNFFPTIATDPVCFGVSVPLNLGLFMEIICLF